MALLQFKVTQTISFLVCGCLEWAMVAAQQVVETPVFLSNMEFCFRLWGDRGRCLTCLSRKSLLRQILGHRTVEVSRCLSFSEEPPLPLHFTLSCVPKYFLDFVIQQNVLWMNSISGLCPGTLTVPRLSLTGHHQLELGMDEGSFFDSSGFESRTRVFKEASEAQSALQPHHKMH